jgi:DNA mismatch repair protein MSH5
MFHLPYALESRPSKEFKSETGKTKLANLHLAQADGRAMQFIVPGDYDNSAPISGLENEHGSQERFLRLCGWLDIGCQITLGCTGAVICYLQRRRAQSFLPGDESSHEFFRVSSVEMFSIQGSMFINADTIHSLQIMESEHHPNAQNQGPNTSRGAKEGFSIYGLFYHLAKTPQGKKRLRTYFLRPSKDVQVIKERLDGISMLLNPSNTEYLGRLIDSLKNIKNMQTLLKNMRKGASGPNRGGTTSVPLWSCLLQFVFHALQITDTIKEMHPAEQTVICQQVINQFDGSVLARVGKQISDVIDMDESRISQRAVINRGIDQDLDQQKQTYDALDSYLVEIAKYIRAKLPTEVQGCEPSIVEVGYYPRIGYVIQVQEEFADELNGYFARSETPWEHIFAAE